jgi:hypothetical protein
MKVGIVGAEESKWTKDQKKIAKEKIIDTIRLYESRIIDDKIIYKVKRWWILKTILSER